MPGGQVVVPGGVQGQGFIHMGIVSEQWARPVAHAGEHAGLGPEALEGVEQGRDGEHVAEVVIAQDKDGGGPGRRNPARGGDRRKAAEEAVEQ